MKIVSTPFFPTVAKLKTGKNYDKRNKIRLELVTKKTKEIKEITILGINDWNCKQKKLTRLQLCRELERKETIRLDKSKSKEKNDLVN